MDIIKLSTIPDAVLQVMQSNKDCTIWYNGIEVKSIYIVPATGLNNKYRINTVKGQYRMNDGDIEIS